MSTAQDFRWIACPRGHRLRVPRWQTHGGTICHECKAANSTRSATWSDPMVFVNIAPEVDPPAPQPPSEEPPQ